MSRSILDEFDIRAVDTLLGILSSTGDVSRAVEIVRMIDRTVTCQRARRLLRYVVHLFNEFEICCDHFKVQCTMLQMDEEWQRLSRGHARWIFNVIDHATRRWLAAQVSRERTFSSSLRVLLSAVKFCIDYKGKKVRCDGLEENVKAIIQMGMVPDSKTKKERYWHINLIERLHRETRAGAIKKRKTFRSDEILQLFVSLERHRWNLLKGHSALGGMTPIQNLCGFRFSRWSDAIRFAEAKVPLAKRLLKANHSTADRPAVGTWETTLKDFR